MMGRGVYRIMLGGDVEMSINLTSFRDLSIAIVTFLHTFNIQNIFLRQFS